MSALRFDSVDLAPGGRPVLTGLNLEVEAGEIVGVLGGNGAGKTTLLRAAIGLLKPSAGRITVFGAPARPGAAAIGTMPQAREAMAGLRISGRALVSAVSNGARWGLPRLDETARHDVERVLGLVDALGYADRPVHTLSGGERQRLLLAQALLGKPRMLLLDEPMASLDPHHQAATVRLVASLGRTLGLTILLSAHELNPLLPVLDRVLYLGGGHAALGRVDEVVTAPVLTRLYGAPIEVVRASGRIFVVAGDTAAVPGPALPAERPHVRL